MSEKVRLFWVEDAGQASMDGGVFDIPAERAIEEWLAELLRECSSDEERAAIRAGRFIVRIA